MDNIVKVISEIVGWVWGPPLLMLIIGGGLIISIRTKFFQIRHLPFILKETVGKIGKKDGAGGEGTVTAFQAMTTALASSIGAANIVVVPSIIFTAGPGAVFWMWVAAIVGMGTKFGEVVLGIKYREKNAAGDFVGGSSYYMKKGIKGTLGKVLGWCMAFFFMLEILPSITLQTLSAVNPIEKVGLEFGLNEILMKNVGIVAILLLTGLVVYGGVKAVGKVTEKMVPFMALIYIVFGLIIIVMHAGELPNAFKMIFVGAFNPKAVLGGAAGVAITKVIQMGVARGVYSNEAGMGSAPYGHAAATVEHPGQQGLWGVFEVFADTIVVCTISAMVVLTTGVWQPGMSEEAAKATSPVAIERAFNTAFGSLGTVIVAIALFLFVLSTIIVIVFYCEKQAEYLWGYKAGLVFRAIACAMIAAAFVVEFNNAGVFLDLTLGLVVIPNMIGLIIMSGQIQEIQEDFFSNPKYYPKAAKNK